MRFNRSLIPLLAFVILCSIATALFTIFLPKLVPQENHCDDHDIVNNEGRIELKNPHNGQVLEMRLNVNRTSKKFGKYFYCERQQSKHANTTCTTYEWRLNEYIRSVTDCFKLMHHWFGGSILWNQEWPINAVNQSEAAFVPGDIYKQEYGGVMERFWINSGGFSIFVDHKVPLFVKMNGHELCFTGSREGLAFDLSAQKDNPALLAYTVCYGTDMKTLYKNLRHWDLPSELPERELFTKPIWSTWAYLKQNISSESVLDYAKSISSHRLSCSQVEIDDKWSTNYGDHEFDATRFPDPKQLISDIHHLGYNVTLWVHPFVNQDAGAYREGLQRMKDGQVYLVAGDDKTQPGYTNWWRGENATLIDVTNSTSSGWKDLMRRLQGLRDYEVDSFKFDGGEVNWLPHGARLANANVNPGWYTNAWSQFAYESDREKRRQETRVGFRAQHFPMLVRTMDKDSHWGFNNGLKAVVTSALTHCLIGYNFLLPDMIGGNAYCAEIDLDGHCYPDEELFIRWLQVSVFMPSLQFSVPPWHYSADVVDITRRLLSIRETTPFIDNMNEALEDAKHGIPIVRPIWWLDDSKPEINDQYLLGSAILVAPILNQNVIKRSVYFPRGNWKRIEESGNGPTYSGPGTEEIEMQLDSIPAFYFTGAT